MRLLVIGFGTVGRGLAEILQRKSAQLQREHGFYPRIVGVLTGSSGSLWQPRGLDLAQLLYAAQSGKLNAYPQQPELRRGLSASEMIAADAADVLVELSPTNLQDAQPALAYCHEALDAGLHVVLANKGPAALGYKALQAKARAKKLELRLEATVMAGTPILQMAREALAGCEILSARGILNGTTNYILTEMEAGMDYAAALAQAQSLGYAEADPSGDVDGWDAAAKVLILARALYGLRLTMGDLAVQGIAGLRGSDIAAARAASQRYKLIAEVSPSGGQVAPRRLPLDDPLAQVQGATNAITLDTDLLGALTLVGPGAGGIETGSAILSDLLAIHRQAAT